LYNVDSTDRDLMDFHSTKNDFSQNYNNWVMCKVKGLSRIWDKWLLQVLGLKTMTSSTQQKFGTA